MNYIRAKFIGAETMNMRLCDIMYCITYVNSIKSLNKYLLKKLVAPTSTKISVNVYFD